MLFENIPTCKSIFHVRQRLKSPHLEYFDRIRIFANGNLCVHLFHSEPYYANKQLPRALLGPEEWHPSAIEKLTSKGKLLRECVLQGQPIDWATVLQKPSSSATFTYREQMSKTCTQSYYDQHGNKCTISKKSTLTKQIKKLTHFVDEHLTRPKQAIEEALLDLQDFENNVTEMQIRTRFQRNELMMDLHKYKHVSIDCKPNHVNYSDWGESVKFHLFSEQALSALQHQEMQEDMFFWYQRHQKHVELKHRMEICQLPPIAADVQLNDIGTLCDVAAFGSDVETSITQNGHINIDFLDAKRAMVNYQNFVQGPQNNNIVSLKDGNKFIYKDTPLVGYVFASDTSSAPTSIVHFNRNGDVINQSECVRPTSFSGSLPVNWLAHCSKATAFKIVCDMKGESGYFFIPTKVSPVEDLKDYCKIPSMCTLFESLGIVNFNEDTKLTPAMTKQLKMVDKLGLMPVMEASKAQRTAFETQSYVELEQNVHDARLLTNNFLSKRLQLQPKAIPNIAPHLPDITLNQRNFKICWRLQKPSLIETVKQHYINPQIVVKEPQLQMVTLQSLDHEVRMVTNSVSHKRQLTEDSFCHLQLPFHALLQNIVEFNKVNDLPKHFNADSLLLYAFHLRAKVYEAASKNPLEPNFVIYTHFMILRDLLIEALFEMEHQISTSVLPTLLPIIIPSTYTTISKIMNVGDCFTIAFVGKLMAVEVKQEAVSKWDRLAMSLGNQDEHFAELHGISKFGHEKLPDFNMDTTNFRPDSVEFFLQHSAHDCKIVYYENLNNQVLFESSEDCVPPIVIPLQLLRRAAFQCLSSRLPNALLSILYPNRFERIGVKLLLGMLAMPQQTGNVQDLIAAYDFTLLAKTSKHNASQV